MTKNAAITAAIVSNLNAGMDIESAIEAVFGPGSYSNIAGMIYDALRNA